MSTLIALDWPRLLNTPDTRWYLDRESWEQHSQCSNLGCTEPPMAYFEYQVSILPGDANDWTNDQYELVCATHLPYMIEYVTGEPLVDGTVVEVGVDPALLRLTGVDPAVVDQFNKHALGVSA